jgi:predicted methyltransferase
VLGDDDLVSLAVASVVRHFGSRKTVANLSVLDVDPAVVAFIRKGLARAPFPVSCLRHDLRDPLPPALVDSFDTVLTDPPYTAAGARLFLSRALEALREGGKVFLSFGTRQANVAFQVQNDLTRMGLVIESLMPDFNRYLGAGVLGGTSHLYRLVASSGLRSLVRGRATGSLYTAEAPRGGAGAGRGPTPAVPQA